MVTLKALDYLVQQQRIDPGRLFICAPEIEQKPEAVPRVEVAI